MRVNLFGFLLLAMSSAPAALGDTILYDNTVLANDTGDTVFYSIGPYVALGDQIQLSSPGTADQAEVEFYNNGVAGTFDAELDFFDVGSPVGTEIGSYDLTDIGSVGSDVIDVTFDLTGGLTVPIDLVFSVTVSNQSDPNMDLGLDMFEPPDVGSSDPTFMIEATEPASVPIYSSIPTPNDEDVYFQLSGTAAPSVPEPSTLILLGAGLVAIGIGAQMRRVAPSRAQ